MKIQSHISVDLRLHLQTHYSSFYWHGLTSIPAWISNHTPVKSVIKSLIHSQSSEVLTTFNHAGRSFDLCKCQYQGYPNNHVFSNFLLWAACWAHFMCHHEFWYPYTQYWFRWTNLSERYRSLWFKPRNGLSSQLPSFCYFPNFSASSWHIWAIAYVHIWKVSS